MVSESVTARPTEPKRAKSSGYINQQRRSEAFWGLLFGLPMFLLVTIFTVYPMIGSYYIALFNWNGIGRPDQFVGLRHIQTVASDPWFWNAFRNNITYTVFLVPIQLSLSLILALILSRPAMKLKLLYRTIFFLPIVTSTAVVAVVVRMMLSNFGIDLTTALGYNPPIDPLSHPVGAMAAVIGFGIWHSFGYNLLFFMAAIQTVPEELFDAAKVDGANWWQTVVYVTLPAIRPVALVILFLAILGSMSVFEQSFVLTRGNPYFASEVVGGYIFRYAFQTFGSSTSINLGYASAAALFHSTLMLGFTVVQYFIVGRVASRNKRMLQNG